MIRDRRLASALVGLSCLLVASRSAGLAAIPWWIATLPVAAPLALWGACYIAILVASIAIGRHAE